MEKMELSEALKANASVWKYLLLILMYGLSRQV